MKDIKFIAVSGFFGSGSSAVVDLLKEYENTYECLAEIRIIKDPYGICELENALIDNWEFINSAAAVRDFLWLSKICARPGKFPLARAGLGYSKTISSKYMQFTYDYINELTKFKYKSDFYYQKFKKKYLKYVFDRCRWGLEYLSKGRIKSTNKHVGFSYFSKPTHNEFNKATKRYFYNLFYEHAFEDKTTYVILDQAISTNNTQVIHRYFDNAKMIIIDRDPRDIFIEGIRWGETLDDNLNTKKAGEEYIIKHKALRDKLTEDKDIIIINFEDLILNYDMTVSKIESFLGFNVDKHLHPRAYLKPEISSKNVAIWKKYYNKYPYALDTIKDGLKEYCWDN